MRLDDEIEVDGVQFKVEDPCSLPDLNSVDCILSALLLCRLPQPKSFLESIPKVLKRSGTCVLVSCYDPQHDSMEDTTTRHLSKGSHKALSEEELKEFMATLGLELIHEENLPFTRRRSSRKYEWNIAHATVWKHCIQSSIL